MGSSGNHWTGDFVGVPTHIKRSGNVMFTTTHAAGISVIVSGFLAINSTINLASAILTPAPIEAFAAFSDPVNAGQLVSIEWQILKRVDCIGSSQRVWTGENGYSKREPIAPTTLPVTDDWQSFEIETRIPENAPEGWLRLSVEGVYDCPERRYPFSLGPVVFQVRPTT